MLACLCAAHVSDASETALVAFGMLHFCTRVQRLHMQYPGVLTVWQMFAHYTVPHRNMNSTKLRKFFVGKKVLGNHLVNGNEQPAQTHKVHLDARS
jgi:hypothetical protein